MNASTKQFCFDVLNAALSCLAPGAVGVLVAFYLGSRIDSRGAWLGVGFVASWAIVDFGRRVWRARRSLRLRRAQARSAELDRQARIEGLAWHARDRAEAQAQAQAQAAEAQAAEEQASADR